MAETCRIPNMVAFVEGVHNGETYYESDIDELVTNFARVGRFWPPYVAFGHANIPAYAEYAKLSLGDVTAARKGRVAYDPITERWMPTARTGPETRAALMLDADNVEKTFGELIQQRRLPRRSIEMFNHECPLKGPDGKPILSNVLKCISFLGPHSEAVKGMPDVSVVFADLPTRPALKRPPAGPAKCFGDPLMEPLTPPADVDTPAPADREAMISQLAAAGAPAEAITEGVPDALLAWIVGILPAPAPAAAPDAAAPAVAFGDRQRQSLQAMVAAAVKAATAPLAPALARSNRAAAAEKATKIKAFGDKHTGGDRPTMTPVQFAALRPMLEQADDNAVKTFGDKKTTGTALDEQLAALSAAYTAPVKTFGDRMTDPLGTSGVRPEVVRQALSGSPEGRAALARLDAAKK